MKECISSVGLPCFTLLWKMGMTRFNFLSFTTGSLLRLSFRLLAWCKFPTDFDLNWLECRINAYPKIASWLWRSKSIRSYYCLLILIPGLVYRQKSIRTWGILSCFSWISSSDLCSISGSLYFRRGTPRHGVVSRSKEGSTCNSNG